MPHGQIRKKSTGSFRVSSCFSVLAPVEKAMFRRALLAPAPGAPAGSRLWACGDSMRLVAGKTPDVISRSQTGAPAGRRGQGQAAPPCVGRRSAGRRRRRGDGARPDRAAGRLRYDDSFS
jgi:hypothetical protein